MALDMARGCFEEERRGQAVLIYVTEPFSETRRVKVDRPERNPRDTFEALKLNIVRDFQTGIYDYNTMVSLFTRSRDFSAVKITFSSAEWCGHVYEETLFERHRVVDRLESYFEGESALRTLRASKGGVAEDQLFILLRDLRGAAFLEPGGKRVVPFLPSPFYLRLGHRHIGWGTAEIERLRRAERVQVPAGRYECDVYVVRLSDGRDGLITADSHDTAHGGGGAKRSNAGYLRHISHSAYWSSHGRSEGVGSTRGGVSGSPEGPVNATSR